VSTEFKDKRIRESNTDFERATLRAITLKWRYRAVLKPRHTARNGSNRVEKTEEARLLFLPQVLPSTASKPQIALTRDSLSSGRSISPLLPLMKIPDTPQVFAIDFRTSLGAWSFEFLAALPNTIRGNARIRRIGNPTLLDQHRLQIEGRIRKTDLLALLSAMDDRDWHIG
jgi:hypothetical protein